MKKHVELPIMPPIYGTYHHQGNSSAILTENPSIINWLYNNAIVLQCNRKFLDGYTTPEVSVRNSALDHNPYVDRCWMPMRFIRGYIHPIIRAALDDGYYIDFSGIDDYYVEGKSWYHQRHFLHDGLICGYDQGEKTYTLFAYDENWVYRTFKTSQKSFEAGRRAAFRQGKPGSLTAIRAKKDEVSLNPAEIRKNLEEHLSSTLEKYPTDGRGMVYGKVVHQYISLFLDRLMDGRIPYERIDHRVFRLLWEHKRHMLNMLTAVENALDLDDSSSQAYAPLVKLADDMRMLYAAHCMKRRDATLPVIQRKLHTIHTREAAVLTAFLLKMEECLDEQTLGAHS